MRPIVLLLLLFGAALTIHHAFADETEGARFSLNSSTTSTTDRTVVFLPALKRAGWKLVAPYMDKGTLHATYERISLSGWANMRVKVRPCDDASALHSNPNTALGGIFLEERLGTLTRKPRLTDGVLSAAYQRKDRSRGMISARVARDPRGARFLLTVISESPVSAPKTYTRDHETLNQLIRLE